MAILLPESHINFIEAKNKAIESGYDFRRISWEDKIIRVEKDGKINYFSSFSEFFNFAKSI